MNEGAVRHAELLTSELASNAIKHGVEPITVETRVEETGFVVLVTDSGATMPIVHEPSLGATGRRGLWLVQRLATRWGVTRRPPGKGVWFSLPLH